MKPLPDYSDETDADTRRSSVWKPIAPPVVATLAIAAVALTTVAFITIFMVFAGLGLAAYFLWRASTRFRRRRAPDEPEITGPYPYTVNIRASSRDESEFDAFLDERARSARQTRHDS